MKYRAEGSGLIELIKTYGNTDFWQGCKAVASHIHFGDTRLAYSISRIALGKMDCDEKMIAMLSKALSLPEDKVLEYFTQLSFLTKDNVNGL